MEDPKTSTTTSTTSTANNDMKIFLRIGENSIQGRRRTQEDSHIFIPNIVRSDSGKSLSNAAVASSADFSAAQQQIDLKAINPLAGIELVNNPDQFALFGVFDGHGGSVASSFVAATLPKYLLEEFDKAGQNTNTESSTENSENTNTTPENNVNENSNTNVTANTSELTQKMEQSLRSAFERIESEFLRKAASEDLKDGTTAAVAILHQHHLIIGNIGDSEVVLSRGGKAIALLNVHNPKRNPDEAQRIVDEGGRLYYDRLAHPSLNGAIFNIAVSRAIGDIFFKNPEYTKNKNSALTAIPDIKSIPLNSDDEFILLACDGLWDVMSHQDAIDFVLPKLVETNDPQFICQLLVDEAYRLGSQDNITSVLITFKSWAAESS